MKLLAFDTSTDACSAALIQDGSLVERYEIAPRRHAKLLLPMIQGVLSEGGTSLSSLDAIGFGRGPGSFTGVRIAAATAQALALGADLPVVPVSSLAALSQVVFSEDGHSRIVAAFDARMNEVYWGAYRAGADGLVQAIDVERVCSPGAVPPPDGEGWAGAGGGWRAYGEQLRFACGAAVNRVFEDRYPAARAVAPLAVDAFRRGERVDPQDALPVYLRDQVTRS